MKSFVFSGLYLHFIAYAVRDQAHYSRYDNIEANGRHTLIDRQVAGERLPQNLSIEGQGRSI
jgi:hypothetical protein